jgi:hypothetical protein
MLLWPLHAHTGAKFKAVSPLPIPAKGTMRISENGHVAIGIYMILKHETGIFSTTKWTDIKSVLNIHIFRL